MNQLEAATMPPSEASRKPTPPRCPICARPAVRDFRPFCSKRCADVDLGRWLGGRYAIPGDPVRPEEMSGDEGDT